MADAKKKPVILVNVADNDPTRGDVAGWKGLANGIAAKVDGQVVYVDKQVIADSYPDEFNADNYDYKQYERLLARYLKPYGPPEYLFGHNCHDALHMLGQDPEDVLRVTNINEGLSKAYSSNDKIVSHHLTPEIMKVEGELFDKMHPGIKHPIMSLFLVDGQHGDEFTMKIVKMMANYPQATIYLCASRRTDKMTYERLKEKFVNKIKELGGEDRIDLLGYAPKQNAYNPYKGLIARSKHFVVCGYSLSMMSEALYSGRTVYLHGVEAPKLYHWRGMVRKFDKLSDRKIPFSKEFEPLNITDHIANGLFKGHLKALKETYKNIKSSLARSQKDWAGHLSAVRQNFNYVETLDGGLRLVPELIEKIVQQRGFALKHLPEYQGDKNIATLAARQNKYAFQFAAQDVRKDFDTVISLFKDKKIEYKDIHMDLRSDETFAREAVAIDASIYPLLSIDLQLKRSIILKAVKQSGDVYEHLPQSVFDDEDFVRDLIDANARIYPHIVKDHGRYFSYEFAMQALKGNCDIYYHVPYSIYADDRILNYVLDQGRGDGLRLTEEQSDNPEILLKAVKVNPSFIGDASMRLLQDPDFLEQIICVDAKCLSYLGDYVSSKSLLLRLLVANPEIIKHHDTIRTNKDLILKALDKNPAVYDALIIADDLEKTYMERGTSLLDRAWARFTGDDTKYLSRDEDVCRVALDAKQRKRVAAEASVINNKCDPV